MNREKIIQARDLLNEILNEQSFPGWIKTRFIEGGRIEITWEPFQTVDPVDIFFYTDGDEKWKHSVNAYLSDHKTPIDTLLGRYIIGGGRDDTHDLTWHVKLATPNNEIEAEPLRPEKKKSKLKSPSGNPADWQCLEKDFLIPSERTWGKKQSTVAPIATFEVDGKIRLLYSGTWGGAVRPCIADWDGERWIDHPQNPVHDKFKDWQYGWRISPGGAFKDGDTYVCFFNEAGSAGETSYYGMRCVGIMTSKNLIEWELWYDPVLTHDMLQDQFSDILKEPTPLIHGRVYCRNAFQYQGETYLTLEVSVDKTNKVAYKLIGVKSKHGVNNWKRFDFGEIIPEDPIVEFEGRYYSTKPIYGQGKRGATIIVADKPTGPYNYLNDRPLFDTSFHEGNHRETCLFNYEGKWHIITGIRDSEIVEQRYGKGVRIMKMAREK